MMATDRISDAQYSPEEVSALQRSLERGDTRPPCPRCGRPLSRRPVEQTGVPPGTLLRCEACRRFVMDPSAGARTRAAGG
jgi:predicted RNA-binding Zn-ribbon protein involved in translation (DUF1610 family)